MQDQISPENTSPCQNETKNGENMSAEKTAAQLVEIIKSEQNNSENNEENTKMKWLIPFLEKAGWDVSSIKGDKYEVRFEPRKIDKRVDCVLKINDRVAVCIELKKAGHKIIDKEKEIALKYGASYYFPFKREKYPILTILTNGCEAIIIDCGQQDPLDSRYLQTVDLLNEGELEKFCKNLSPSKIDQKNGSLPYITTQKLTDQRMSVTEGRAADFVEQVKHFTSHIVNNNSSISFERAKFLTIYAILLAAARDNDIIPCNELRTWISTKEAHKIKEHFDKLFGTVVESLTDQEIQALAPIYEETRSFPLRLDVVPVEFIGLVYEELIKHDFGKKEKLTEIDKDSTIFYTPTEIVDEIIEYCNPSIGQSILDPTCGSGIFLAKSVQFAIKNAKKNGEIDILSKTKTMSDFISKVHGTDKDPLACAIAKTTLLMTFMKEFSDEDFRREYDENKKYNFVLTGKKLPYPQIFHVDDFLSFDTDGEYKYNIVLGNPPWDSIDQCKESQKIIVKNKDDWKSYKDKNDILCYITEKAIKTHLYRGGKFGFVIKRQSFYGDSYDNYISFLDDKIEKIVDYGAEKLFNNNAETIVVLGRDDSIGTKLTKWKIEKRFPQKTIKLKNNVETVFFYESFVATQGSQSSANNVYKEFAKTYPKDSTVRSLSDCVSFGGTPINPEKIAFFFEDKVPSNFIKWAKGTQIKKAGKTQLAYDLLVKRKDVKTNDSENEKMSWRRDNTAQITGGIIVFDYIVAEDRKRFLLDINRRFVSLTKNTCIGTLKNDSDLLYFFCGLVSSKFFIPLLRYCLFSSRVDGLFLSSAELNKLLIPVLNETDFKNIVTIVKDDIDKKNGVQPNTLQTIDNVFNKYMDIVDEINFSFFYTKTSPFQYFYGNVFKADIYSKIRDLKSHIIDINKSFSLELIKKQDLISDINRTIDDLKALPVNKDTFDQMTINKDFGNAISLKKYLALKNKISRNKPKKTA